MQIVERNPRASIDSNGETQGSTCAHQHVFEQENIKERSLLSDKPRYEEVGFHTQIPNFNSKGNGKDGALILDFRKYDSPFEWSATRKNMCLFLSCAATFSSSYSVGSFSIASNQLQPYFNVSDEVFALGITTWCVGFACSPMFLAPLSELQGRRPVFLLSGLLFLAAQIGCAATNSFAGMLVARFFVGVGASTFATMVGGVISDVYHAEDRNTPMAVYSAAALSGTGVGPLVGGFITTRISWRWVFWHQVIFLGAVMVAMVLLFKETRGSVLLARKAAALNNYLDNLHEQDEKDAERSNQTTRSNVRYMGPSSASHASIARLLYLSLTTPFKLLFTESVVFWFSMWASFAWAVLYLQLNVIPLVFRTNHNFNVEQNGLVFLSLVVGVLLGGILAIYQEKLTRRYYPKLFAEPEGRLYFACLEAAFLPIGLFWFGWTTASSIHWIVPAMALVFAMLGIFSIYLAVFNYLADVYHRYASSALACQSFCRNILAAVFPLFSQAMFKKLGFAGAGSMLGGIAAILTIVPWVLVFYGPRIRARSKVASELLEKRG